MTRNKETVSIKKPLCKRPKTAILFIMGGSIGFVGFFLLRLWLSSFTLKPGVSIFEEILSRMFSATMSPYMPIIIMYLILGAIAGCLTVYAPKLYALTIIYKTEILLGTAILLVWIPSCGRERNILAYQRLTIEIKSLDELPDYDLKYNYAKVDYDKRPVFIVFLSPPNRPKINAAEFVWDQIFPIKSNGFTLSTTRSTISNADYSFGATAGMDDKTIADNLNILTGTSAGLWWEKHERGYLLCLNNKIKKEDILFGLEEELPPTAILSPNLNSTTAFLSELMKVPVVINSENAIQQVKNIELFPGQWSSTMRTQVFHFQTQKTLPVKAYLNKIAMHHGCILNITQNQIQFDPPNKEETKRIVQEAIDEYKNYSSEDPTPYTMPSGAESELATYLDNPDENIVQLVLEALISINKPVNDEQLMKIVKGDTKFGHGTRGLAAAYLMRTGNLKPLPYLEEIGQGEYQLYDMVITAGWSGKEKGTDIQKKLLLQAPKKFSLFKRPTKLNYANKSNINETEVNYIVDMAILVAHAFSYKPRNPQTTVYLQVSSDGQNAICYLTAGSYVAELWASGQDYRVYFKKIGEYWFVIDAKDGAHWVS